MREGDAQIICVVFVHVHRITLTQLHCLRSVVDTVEDAEAADSGLVFTNYLDEEFETLRKSELEFKCGGE